MLWKWKKLDKREFQSLWLAELKTTATKKGSLALKKNCELHIQFSKIHISMFFIEDLLCGPFHLIIKYALQIVNICLLAEYYVK